MPFVGNLRVGGTYKYYVEVSLTYLNVTKLPCGTTARYMFRIKFGDVFNSSLFIVLPK